MINIEFSEAEIDALHCGRFHDAQPKARVKMEALYLKSHGMSHDNICKLMRISKHTLISYLRDYLDGGIEKLRETNHRLPVSELAKHKEKIKAHFQKEPPTTLKEAMDKIEQLTGLKRSLTQIRKFLKSIGMRLLKMGAIPAKADPVKQNEFKTDELEPCLEEAKSGKRQVFFVDAAHFVHGAFLGFVWCFQRLFLKTPSGRKRFNVLGALNAVTNELITVTNESYINALSVCDLLKKIAQNVIGKPITLVLDNAKYQKCKIVAELAKSLTIELLYLPSYSPNLNLIERLWKFVKKTCLYSKYYEKFNDFKAAISDCLHESLIDKSDELKTLLTLNFQTFEKVQFVAL